MAWSLANRPGIPRWLAWRYGSTAPLIGLLGLMINVLQPIGSTLLIVAGALIANRLTRPERPGLRHLPTSHGEER